MKIKASSRVGFALAVGTLFSPNLYAVSRITHLHILFRAFIPNKHPSLPGYFTQTDKGTWVLHAPTIPLPSSVNLGKLSNTCFETDNRSFDSSPVASARMTVEFELLIDGRQVSLQKAGSRDLIRAGETRNVDCRTGVELQAPQRASVSGSSISDVKTSNFKREVDVRISAANPFYVLWGINVAPRIDYSVVLEYDVLTQQVHIKGNTGKFPAFEGYYQVDDGPMQTAVRLSPADQATAASLLDLGTSLNMRDFGADIRGLRGSH